jgi:hypothetical protein
MYDIMNLKSNSPFEQSTLIDPFTGKNSPIAGSPKNDRLSQCEGIESVVRRLQPGKRLSNLT